MRYRCTNFATVTPSPPSLFSPVAKLADERMAAQLVAHGLAQRAGALAVDDPDKGQTGKIGGVEIAIKLDEHIVYGQPAQVQLHARAGRFRLRAARLNLNGGLLPALAQLNATRRQPQAKAADLDLYLAAA